MATLDKTLVNYGAPAPRNPLLTYRKIIDGSVDTVASGTDYAIFKLPKGFSPVRACVRVITTQATTVDVDVMDVDGNTKGILLNDASLAGEAYVIAGDDEIGITAVVDGDVYVAIDVAATLTTAKFEVTVMGYSMLDPDDCVATLSDEDDQ